MINRILGLILVFFLCFFITYIFFMIPLYFFLGGMMVVILFVMFLFKPIWALFFSLTLLMLKGLYSGGGVAISSISLDSGGLINFLIPIFGIAYLIVHRRNILISGVSNLYGIFLFLAFLSCFLSSDKISAFKYFVRLITPITIYFLVVYEISKANRKKLLDLILLLSLIPISLGYWELFQHGSLFYRVRSIFGHANPFSFFLVFIFIVALVFTYNERKARFFYGAYAATTAFLIVLTYCRISLVVMFLDFFLLSLFCRKQKLILCVTIGIVCAMLFVFPKGDVIRLEETVSFFQQQRWFDTSNSIGWRLAVWVEVFKEYLNHPFIGWGLREHFNLVENLVGMKTSVHNTYLEVLYDTGILGFIAFLGFIFQLLRHASSIVFKMRQSIEVSEDQPYLLMFLSGVVSFIFILSTDNLLEYFNISTFYWLFFAFGVQPLLIRRKQQNLTGFVRGNL